MVTLNETYSIIVILIGTILLFCYIYGVRNIEYRNIIFAGLLFRLLLLFADYFKWFPILNSGADSEAFHLVSVANVKNYTDTLKTNYVVFVTFIYRLTDCSRLIVQFINVIFGMGIIFMIQRMLQQLNVTGKNMKYAMIIIAFLPNINIFSAILLREAWIEFFITLSLFAFVQWILKGGAHNVVLSIAAVLAGSYMHAGVIGVMFGYIVAYIIYNPSTGKITISRNTIISLIFLFLVATVSSSYMGLFTGKFAEYESVDDIVDVTNRTSGGGSDYLTWVNTNSVAQSLLFAPLKMFYFLFAPLPTEWRGVRDVMGFVIDGGIYMYMFYIMYKFKATTETNKSLKKFLLISIAIVTFIFGYGTTNAGTAFRHRAKNISVIVVTFALSTIKPKNYDEQDQESGDLSKS